MEFWGISPMHIETKIHEVYQGKASLKTNTPIFQYSMYGVITESLSKPS